MTTSEIACISFGAHNHLPRLTKRTKASKPMPDMLNMLTVRRSTRR